MSKVISEDVSATSWENTLSDKKNPSWAREHPLSICSFFAFTFTWYLLKSISLTSSKSLYGFSLTEARPSASVSSSYISVRLFLPHSYNLTLSAFESQYLNFMELLNSCKYFIRLTRLSSVHLKRACEVVIFTF